MDIKVLVDIKVELAGYQCINEYQGMGVYLGLVGYQGIVVYLGKGGF